MGLRSWLFGCRGHHWERTEFSSRNISLQRLDFKEPTEYYVQIKAQYECKHGGFGATKMDWEHTVSLSEERGEEILDELKGEEDG